MIVCVCNALNDKALRKACEGCPRGGCAEQVLASLGVKPQCGQCACYIEDVMLPQTHASSHAASLANANASELLPA